MKRTVLFFVISLLSLGTVSVSAQTGTDQTDFSGVITEEIAHVPRLVDAYDVLRATNLEVMYKDLADEASEASLPEEVKEIADQEAGLEGEITALNERETLLFYLFESDEVFEGFEDAEEPVPMQANLAFLFMDNELSASIATVYSYSLDDSMFMSSSEISKWLTYDMSLDELELMDQSVMSYSTLVVDDTDYHALVIPTIDDDGTMAFDNVIFEGAVVYESPYFYLDEFTQTFMDINMLNMIDQVAPQYFD